MFYGTFENHAKELSGSQTAGSSTGSESQGSTLNAFVHEAAGRAGLFVVVLNIGGIPEERRAWLSRER